MFDDRGNSDLHFRTEGPPLLTDEPAPALDGPPAPRPRPRAHAGGAPSPAAPGPFVDDDLPTSFFRRRRGPEGAPRPRAGDRPAARPQAPAGPAPRRREPSARAGVGQSTVLLPSSDGPAAAVADDGTVILPGRATPSHVDAVTEPGRRRAPGRRRDPAAELRALVEALLQRRGPLAAALGVVAAAALTCALTRGDDPGALPEILGRVRWIALAAGGAFGG